MSDERTVRVLSLQTGAYVDMRPQRGGFEPVMFEERQLVRPDVVSGRPIRVLLGVATVPAAVAEEFYAGHPNFEILDPLPEQPAEAGEWWDRAGGQEDDANEDTTDTWDGKLAPDEYLKRWPDGPKAELARRLVAASPE